MIKLPRVIYDKRAWDGTWCKLPYPGHPKGCLNFPKCPQSHIDFQDTSKIWTHWYAVIEEFDLEAQALEMLREHPLWSERQCRNLLYWQKGVMKRLREKALADWRPGDVILEIPEATGVNVFETMAEVGIHLQRNNIRVVKKIMLIGKG